MMYADLRDFIAQLESKALLQRIAMAMGKEKGGDATAKWPGETSRPWGKPIKVDALVEQRIDGYWTDLGLVCQST